MRRLTLLVLLFATALAGCGTQERSASHFLRGVAPIGRGPAFELPSLTRATAAGRPVGALRCARNTSQTFVAHVELFAEGKVVLLPPGIGIAPPRVAEGAYVRGGRCRYPVWTDEPTGVVAVGRRGLRLRDLFAVWGTDLGRRGAAGFKGDVVVHVGGLRHTGAPGDVRLTPRAQIVVQVGGPRVVPHARYTFP